MDLSKFPSYSEDHFYSWISELTPIRNEHGYLIKHDDEFSLGGICGGKVRQCAKLVHDNLTYIKNECNGGLVTAAGLPSPQSAIVSAVARYFGLKCLVSVPKYPDHMRDFNRINVSVAQQLGSTIYGTGNPNLSGPEKDARLLSEQFGYFQVKFGMAGMNVMKTVSHQVQNLPDEMENVVSVGGSGFSILGAMLGFKKYNKNVKNVHVITLSGYFNKSKKDWYDPLPDKVKYDGNLHIHKSPISYQKLHKINDGFEFDLTYESKAWEWLIHNIPASKDTLFWIVGKKIYDLNEIRKIDWHTSTYEETLNLKRSQKQKTIKHNFFNVH